MKTLILVRHAKSSWADEELSDQMRPLNKRGKRDAPVMGKRLAKRGIKPDLMLSSSAVRALATARVVAGALGYPEESIASLGQLYLALPGDILHVIHELDNQLDCVMLFGHNPGFTQLANWFSPTLISNVPTCGVIEVRFDIERWSLVGQGAPAYFRFDYPKKNA